MEEQIPRVCLENGRLVFFTRINNVNRVQRFITNRLTLDYRYSVTKGEIAAVDHVDQINSKRAPFYVGFLKHS